jgi:hypothetical protein
VESCACGGGGGGVWGGKSSSSCLNQPLRPKKQTTDCPSLCHTSCQTPLAANESSPALPPKSLPLPPRPKKKIQKPTFFIWSNDFDGVEKYFKRKDCIFVKNNDVIMDFYLFSICKHFIVGISTFHWMGAWLNQYRNKICIRPKNTILNPSNNIDFWPTSWEKI